MVIWGSGQFWRETNCFYFLCTQTAARQLTASIVTCTRCSTEKKNTQKPGAHTQHTRTLSLFHTHTHTRALHQHTLYYYCFYYYYYFY